MMLKLFLGFAFGLTLCVIGCRDDPPNHLRHDPNYTHAYMCPIDCENGKMYEHPDSCPVCHMKFLQKEVRVNDLNMPEDSTKKNHSPMPPHH